MGKYVAGRRERADYEGRLDPRDKSKTNKWMTPTKSVFDCSDAPKESANKRKEDSQIRETPSSVIDDASRTSVVERQVVVHVLDRLQRLAGARKLAMHGEELMGVYSYKFVIRLFSDGQHRLLAIQFCRFLVWKRAFDSVHMFRL